MRSIWKGSLNLKGGIFSIPVKIYSATSTDESVHSHQIHDKCNSRVKRPLFCEMCNRIIENNEVKKAFTLSEGNHVILEKSDFDAIPSALKELVITQFCKANEIDVRAYDKSYFISVEKGGERAFTLLLELLSNIDIVGVVKWTYRDKERLAIVRCFGNVVLLQTLKYSNELRDTTEVEPDTEYIPDEKTLRLMTKVVSKLIKPFKHAKFRDKYSDALKEVIATKARGGKIVKAKEAVKTVAANDVVDALKQTLMLLDRPKKIKKPIRKSGRTAGTDKPKFKKKKKKKSKRVN